jgi:predicted amidohydrolase YtcJ
MIAAAAALNIDVHIHALGERAAHESLNAIEAVRKIAPDSASRYTLTHIQVVTDQDVPRFGELDVIAQSTPLWATYDTYGKEFISDDQFQRYFRFKSVEDAGGRLAFGSDFPASGLGTLGLSPLLQIELGHTRQYPGDPDSPLQPRASERLSVASLVRGFTLGAAYQLHMEDDIGSIEVGKKADLVVLDQNIFEIDPFTIHETAVVMTMMNGNIVYSESPSNVFLSEFTGPYGGVPRFDAMQVADLKPALVPASDGSRSRSRCSCRGCCSAGTSGSATSTAEDSCGAPSASPARWPCSPASCSSRRS